MGVYNLRRSCVWGVVVEDSKGGKSLIPRSLGQMWVENKKCSSFVEIEYIRALGLFQESDISHFIIVAYANECFKGC